jgi:hydroxymethylbilane synthase
VTIAAVPTRGDPRDALVAGGGRLLADLRLGATVGTGSPRRAAQLRALRPDLDVTPVRGNVDTRLRLVAAGTVDAVVVALAGLVRLGRHSAATETLDADRMLPAPGQGALAVEVSRRAGSLCSDIADAIDDPDSRAAVTAERALLAELEAGCSAPVGALAVVDRATGRLSIRAIVLATDGSRAVRLDATGPPGDPQSLGRQLAGELLVGGAAGLVKEAVS